MSHKHYSSCGLRTADSVLRTAVLTALRIAD